MKDAEVTCNCGLHEKCEQATLYAGDDPRNERGYATAKDLCTTGPREPSSWTTRQSSGCGHS
eukprot:scaffold18_cov401-Prasinococcus_capsulatus_cf.AAC.5